MMEDALRFRRQVIHLHSLGVRAIAEFLEAIAKEADCAALILELLTEYELRLCPDTVRLVGGDRFPRRLPMLVPK